MKTNELKKGTYIRLRNGWFATIIDNAKGNTRMADVEGYCREMGSIYSHDIVQYRDAAGKWHNDIELTPSQIKCRKLASSL